METNKNDIFEIFFGMAGSGISSQAHSLGCAKTIDLATQIAELSVENSQTRKDETQATADKRNVFYAIFLIGCSSQVHSLGAAGVVDLCKSLSDLAIAKFPAEEGSVQL